MKPLWAKQIDGEDDEGEGSTEVGNNPLNPTGGGTPGSPKQSPNDS